MARIVERNLIAENEKWNKFFIIFLLGYTFIFILSWIFPEILIYIFYLFVILVLICAIAAVFRKYSIAEYIYILAGLMMLSIGPHLLDQPFSIIPFVFVILFFLFLNWLYSFDSKRTEIIEVDLNDAPSFELNHRFIREIEDWLSTEGFTNKNDENKITVELGDRKWIWISISDESKETRKRYIIELKTHRTKESTEYTKIKDAIINILKNITKTNETPN